MALALRVAYLAHSTGQWSRWPQEHRRLVQMCCTNGSSSSQPRGRGIIQKAYYSTQEQAKATKSKSMEPTPPQIKRNVASEITSVGKVLYDAGWDAKSSNGRQQIQSNATTRSASTPSDQNKKKDPEQDTPKTKREQMRDNMQDYIFMRYFNYVKNYDTVLEKNFPKAMELYRAFFVGVKDFFADMKRFLKVARIANGSPQGIRALNRQELELYMQMPRDMMKVAPALIGCSLPMRVEFQNYFMKRRLQCNKSVLRCLQAKLKSIEAHHKHQEFECILGQLGSGTHPSPEALIAVKDIFAEGPYSLLGMSRKHIKCLINLHALPSSLFKRHRLHEHAFMVHYMDLAITREGGVHNLSLAALRHSCYLRGLNPDGLSSEQMIEWLRNWVKVSTSIHGEHITLFLHLPILLGYNHPNNWKTIYHSKES